MRPAPISPSREPAGPGPAVSSSPGVALYLDWAVSRGVEPWLLPAGDPGREVLAARLARFRAEVPCAQATWERRETALRRVADLVGHPWPPVAPQVPDEAHARVLVASADTRVESMLSVRPWRGWPAGLRGRRDAFVIVMRHLGLTRAQTLALRPASVRPARPGDLAGVTDAMPDPADRPEGRPVGLVVDLGAVGQVLVPRGGAAWPDPPRACPACAVLRWVEVAAEVDRWGRSGARDLLIRACRSVGDEPAHLCERGLPEATWMSWREVTTVVPAIDPHGWVADWRPMTPRALTTVLGQAPAPRPDPAPDPVRDPVPGLLGHRDRGASRPHVDLDLDDLFATLDDAASSADEVNDRIRALLDDTDSLLGEITRRP